MSKSKMITIGYKVRVNARYVPKGHRSATVKFFNESYGSAEEALNAARETKDRLEEEFRKLICHEINVVSVSRTIPESKTEYFEESTIMFSGENIDSVSIRLTEKHDWVNADEEKPATDD